MTDRRHTIRWSVLGLIFVATVVGVGLDTWRDDDPPRREVIQSTTITYLDDDSWLQFGLNPAMIGVTVFAYGDLDDLRSRVCVVYAGPGGRAAADLRQTAPRPSLPIRCQDLIGSKVSAGGERFTAVSVAFIVVAVGLFLRRHDRRRSRSRAD